MKRLTALLLSLCLLCTLAACQSGNPNATSHIPTEAVEPVKEGVYIRDSYTVTGQEAIDAASQVVATMGDKALTGGVFHAFYWMAVYTFMETYGSDAMYYGLSYNKPLDEQAFDKNGTWQHYFIEEALGVWHSYQALALKAEELGLSISPEFQQKLDGLYDSMAESAEKGSYDSVEAMIAAQMGAGCSYEDYYEYTRIIYLSYAYYDYMYAQMEFTQADIDAYFEENQALLAESDITKESGDAYDVHHIMVQIDGGQIADDSVVYTDEDWEACRIRAQAILHEWLTGEATEASFTALADQYAADEDASTIGGLYEGLTEDSGLGAFTDWYCDDSRQVGDYGLVKTDYGYHVMYLSAREPAWIYNCRNILYDNAIAEFINAAIDENPIEITYENIALGEVTLVADS